MVRWLSRTVRFYLVSIVAAHHLVGTGSIWAVDISDLPLETAIQGSPPVLVFVVDNSASMGCEFLTTEPFGLFDNHCRLFPEPLSDAAYTAIDQGDRDQRLKWQSQAAAYNSLYYSPRIDYPPWPSTAVNRFEPSNLHRPLVNAVHRHASAARLSMASEFASVDGRSGRIAITNAHYFTHLDIDGNGRWDMENEPIYLVTWQDGDGDGLVDLSDDAEGDCRRYFRYHDDGDDIVEAQELVEELDIHVIEALGRGVRGGTGRIEKYAADRQDLQNFVNWFTYYRSRSRLATALIADYIVHSTAARIGLYAVNGAPRQPVRLVAAGSGSDQPAETSAMLDALYAMEVGGGSNLRRALDEVGRYLHQDIYSPLGSSPIGDAGGGGRCQRSVAVLVTDGFMNGQYSGTGNVDGGSGPPFADGWGDTLADIAMDYYRNDLAPDLPDDLLQMPCDDAVHQHMSTFVVGLGSRRSIEDGYPAGQRLVRDACELRALAAAVTWPQPHYGQGSELPPVGGPSQQGAGDGLLDVLANDLLHAAANGRGAYIAGAEARWMSNVLAAAVAHLQRPGSAAGITVSGAVLSDASTVYQATFNPMDWSGDLLAIPSPVGTEQNDPVDDRPVWRASSFLDPMRENWDERCLITYGGGQRQPHGIPFRYGRLSADQAAALGSDLASGSPADRSAATLLDFIRGRRIDGYRKRSSLLGDIVHSPPVLFGHTVFAGANDGMLHAIDTRTGRERFGYIPGLVFTRLRFLADTNYTDEHRFFVDGPSVIGEVLVGQFCRRTFLVGGLGKGGKGYFCLSVGQRERTAGINGYGAYRWVSHVDTIGPGAVEDRISSLVQWEYPRPDVSDDGMDNDGDGSVDESGEQDPHIGYGFSEAYAVNANCRQGQYCPVVVFGNGYDSAGGTAVLYVLDAVSGRLVRKIDTGAGGDNGLSSPALIDIDLDRKVDYAYAGDLQGNLWKFDLRADTPAQWGVAYGADKDGDGMIDAAAGDLPAPLFTARGQSITGRPDITMMRSLCATQAPGYMVIFGTGRLLGFSDIARRRQHSIFGIWDYGDDGDDSEYLGYLVDRDRGLLSSGLVLQKQRVVGETIVDERLSRQLSVHPVVYGMVQDHTDGDGNGGNGNEGSQKPNPSSCAGWFLDFPVSSETGEPTGEQVTGNVAIRGGKAMIVSHAPRGDDPCAPDMGSWLYLVSACDGSPPVKAENAWFQPMHFQAAISGDPLILKEVMQQGTDTLLFSDTRGRLYMEKFEGEPLGVVYWRQSH